MPLILLLAQLPLLAAGAFQSLGAGKACRATADATAQCSETDSANCRSLYDVLTEFDKARCQAVCEALAASCTGFEINEKLKRCEIWKAPILAAADAADWECLNGSASGESDSTLYFSFDLLISNLDWPKVNASGDGQSFGGLLSMAAKTAVKTTYQASAEPSKVGEGNIMVYFDMESQKVTVGIEPSKKTTDSRTALVMYALLRRSSDFKDGTTPGLRQKLTSEALPQSLASVPNITGWLTDAGPALFEVSNRRLGTSRPMDNIPRESKEQWKKLTGKVPGGSKGAKDTTMTSTVAPASSTSEPPQSVSKAWMPGPAWALLLATLLHG